MTMTHEEWMREHQRIDGALAQLRARREELMRHSSYIPGPVLQKRQNVLDNLEAGLLDEIGELVELDRDGAVA